MLKRGDKSWNWIKQLRSPHPTAIVKDVKIFKWSSPEAVLVKIVKKHVNFKFNLQFYLRY